MKFTLRFGVVITFCFLWVAGVQAKPTEVTNVRIGVHAEKTRLVLEADGCLSLPRVLARKPLPGCDRSAEHFLEGTVSAFGKTEALSRITASACSARGTAGWLSM